MIDALRGTAIAAMIIYHFSWDLSLFGLIAVDVINEPGWRAFARLIAGTFVTLVGVSLVLATRSGLNIAAFLRRLVVISAAAGLVTIGTWFWFPDAFVFFGILHLIAFASVAALPFLRMLSGLILALAAAVFILPFFYTNEIFSSPWLWWVGLTPRPPTTVDYVPVFPWFSLTLIGIVGGRLLVSHGSEMQFAKWRPASWLGRLAVNAGRWSLLIYLIHQPLLIGSLNLVTLFVGAQPGAAAATFRNDCVATCRGNANEAPVCEAYCGCVLSALETEGLLPLAVRGQLDAVGTNRWLELVSQCRPGQGAPALPR